MQASDLRPARFFAQNYGVKILVYGDPGTGKTPLINTLPNPVMLACEPGLRSMSQSDVPTWTADTPARIDEFFAWCFSSAEVRHFQTIAVDSVSQLAEIYLDEEVRRNKHGLKAYGNMAERTMAHLGKLYFMQQKHVYLIAKQAVIETDAGAIRRPYFPGKQLNVWVPHHYDEILHIGSKNVPGAGQVVGVQTSSSLDILARDRSGKLAAFEPPNMGNIIAKAMA